MSPPPPPPLSIYTILPSLLEYKESFLYLQFHETDLAQFYTLYRQVKHPQETNKEVLVEKLIKYFDISESEFVSRILNPTQNIANIFELIFILWQFCTIGKHLGELF
jgi:hypothetical protein